MVNILIIESREGDGILNEVIDFLSERTHCQVTHLPSCPDKLSFPGLEIRPREQMVYRDGELVSMTYHEFFILLYLARHPGWVFSKEQIYEMVWKESGTNCRTAVTNVVSQIGRKVGGQYIKTVAGSGYKFEA